MNSIIKRHHTLGWLVLAVGLLMLMTLTPARAADAPDNPGQLSAADYKFAVTAAHGGAFEVNLGRLALQKSTDEDVKQFGQHMVDDHSKAGNQLADIASRKGAGLPTDPSSEQQKQMDRLNNLSGHEFDKAYISLMVRAHKTDLKGFKHAAEEVQDPDLKSFAGNTIPMIQDHLKMVEGIEENLKGRLSVNR